MNESNEFQNTVGMFEEKMVEAESKLGINPLELWMNEMIAKKRNQESMKEEEQKWLEKSSMKLLRK